jgi:CHAT domain-containing protein
MRKQLVIHLLLFLPIVACFGQRIEAPSNTKIADSLDALGNYKESIPYRDLALLENDHSKDYQLLIQAKWHYTKSCIYESTGGKENHKKGLEHSLKAKDIAAKINTSIIFFKHEITNRIYHQYGYTGNWKKALIEAKENYTILKDTFPDHHPKILWIIDDLGFISRSLHDNETSLKYYNWSLPLYKNNHPEKIEDLAMNYNRMASNYRELGLRKKEYEILKESESIWDDNEIEGYFGSKFSCYEQLVTWNIYYGNRKEAEYYLRKQETLMPQLTAALKDTERPYLSRRYYLRIYYNYIALYIQSEQFTKARTYLELYKEQLPKNQAKHSFEVHFKALYHSYLAKMPDVEINEEIRHLQQAISIADMNADAFYINSKPYELQLLKSYLKAKLDPDALGLIEELMNDGKETDDNLKFYLLSNKANLHALLGENYLAEKEFTESLLFLVDTEGGKLDLKTISLNQLKPFYTFETVNGLLFASKFYEEKHRINQIANDLQISKNLVVLASKVFDKLYLGDRYNENLFKGYKKIEQQALSVLTLNSNENDVKTILEALENNTTKYTWSKFVYSEARRNLNVPDTLVDRENELKSLIHYYQNELFKKKEERLNLDTLKTRLTESNYEFHKLQTFIKKKFTSYYNSNFEAFDLSAFQKNLPDKGKILKYIISDKSLYCFIISRNEIGFHRIEQPKNFEIQIENYIDDLKTFNSNIGASLSGIHPILPDRLNITSETKITIIPDGILCYLPFEALQETTQFIHSKNSFSYASSLSLLKDQNKISSSTEAITLGYFSAQYDDAKQLPYLVQEERSLLNSFQGQSFYNMSTAQLMKNAKKFDVLHFAMHSTIDKENPEFSNFNLGNEKLLMSDLYHESFKAQMAVLSACETGSGNFVNGEGIQSVSKAFTYTGIPSIVMSLWKVDDESTSKIMSEFYKNLKKGQAKDQALKNSKITYVASVEDEALKHPYYWAGFIVSGNTNALVSNNNTLYWSVGIAISILILFLFWFVKTNLKQ